MSTEPVLKSQNMGTQIDIPFADTSTQSYSYRGNSNFLGLERFEMQPQTDLNLWLDNSP